MELRVIPLSPSHNGFFPNSGLTQLGVNQNLIKHGAVIRRRPKFRRVSAKLENEEEEEPKKDKQSLFGMVTDALDFSQVRSEEDAQLLQEARETTKSGEKMSKEQYGALRRKIGGTYKDFFKSYIEVDGQYVEEGWVDKTCRICKKDTRGEPRQVDKMGRYAHVACLEKPDSGNFFTRLFSR